MTFIELSYDDPYGKVEAAKTIVSANVTLKPNGALEYDDFQVNTLMGGFWFNVTKAFADDYPSPFHLWFEGEVRERFMEDLRKPTDWDREDLDGPKDAA